MILDTFDNLKSNIILHKGKDKKDKRLLLCNYALYDGTTTSMTLIVKLVRE